MTEGIRDGVGRVLGTQHTSTREFRVVLDDDEYLQLDDLVVVRTQVPKAGEVRTYGIVTEAEQVHTKILKKDKPSLKFPIRSLANVRYAPKQGYFEIRGKKKERTLTVNTVKTFAQTLRMRSRSKEMVLEDTFATRRDASSRGAGNGNDGRGSVGARSWKRARSMTKLPSSTSDTMSARRAPNTRSRCVHV